MSQPYRVNITGQFNVGNPYCINVTEPFGLIRASVPTDDQPSNYNTFCDEIDTVLQKLIPVRNFFKRINYVYFLLIAIAILPQFLFRFLDNVKNYFAISMGFVGVVFLIIAVVLFFYYRIYVSMKTIYGEVEGVCTRYSVPNVVTYMVKNEWWGGCSKAHARRYFLLVIIDKSGGGGGNDIEQGVLVGAGEGTGGTSTQQPIQATTVDNFDSNPYSNTSSAPSAPPTTNGGGTSLFDQLSGTK